MNEQDIVKILDEMGDLLELTEENPFKARAYYRGAQALRENPGFRLDDVDSLQELPGIGTSLANLICELQTDEDSSFYRELKGKVPGEFRKLLHIPGLGPKTIRLILQELKPASIADLERALEHREIRKIKGLSSKTEAKLKRGLEMLEDRPSSFSLGIALPLGRELLSFLAKLPAVSRAEIVGSTARGRETVGDLDILVGCADPDQVARSFAAHPRVEKVLNDEDNHLRCETWFGLPIDLYLVSQEAFSGMLEHLKGDVGHHAKLRQLGKSKGLNWGLIPLEAYEELGLPVLPPELREGGAKLTLPENLLQLRDIRGDLHMHTRWSDGGCSIFEMARAAQARGYEYIAICDHTRNLPIAKGLKPEQLQQQSVEIEEVNRELKSIKVLHGTEVDILKDGSLDFPDEVLRELDVVVASVHLRYKQGMEAMTSRIEAALKNPHVDILAHPTGRLIGRREPYDLQLERVFEAAARNKKALEINASPSRLDLKDKYASMARDWGVPVVIDTDAHAVEELADMEYGVMTARRAALEKDNVLNTKPLDQFEKWLNR